MYPESRQSAKFFLKSSELGLPQPLTRRRVWGEGWESPNSDEGTYSLYIRTLGMYLMSISSPSMRVIEPGVIPPSMWAWGKENISVKILYTAFKNK
jgi:hypothetical protein